MSASRDRANSPAFSNSPPQSSHQRMETQTKYHLSFKLSGPSVKGAIRNPSNNASIAPAGVGAVMRMCHRRARDYRTRLDRWLSSLSHSFELMRRQRQFRSGFVESEEQIVPGSAWRTRIFRKLWRYLGLVQSSGPSPVGYPHGRDAPEGYRGQT